jgi:catechol 2,3-dioxygenase-like lactoylglutathione lyase family enzyme
MKRFHVHIAVDDLPASIRFYSTVFGTDPTVQKSDYAKWMIDDPRINFAISSRGGKPGVNHLGFQVDSGEEFEAMRAQLTMADAGLVEEVGAHCCYAKSDKYWITDPTGIAWETYRTLGSIPLFGGDAQDACCAGDQHGQAAVAASEACCTSLEGAGTSCCAPAEARERAAGKACCSS